jgi:hypothetical protein
MDDFIRFLEFESMLNELTHQNKKKKRNIQRDREFGINAVLELDDVKFKRTLRVSRNLFNEILTQMTIYFGNNNNQKAINSSGSAISHTTALMCTLRYLAGGSYLDICLLFGVSESALFGTDGIVWKTIGFIVSHYQNEINFPIKDTAELDKISEDFSQLSNGQLNGCVMAIDGWVCKTRQPTKKEVENVNAFRNRKGY